MIRGSFEKQLIFAFCVRYAEMWPGKNLMEKNNLEANRLIL